MSAIGDYIHYSEDNYLRYGTNRNSGKNNFFEVYRATRENIFDKFEGASNNWIEDNNEDLRKVIAEILNNAEETKSKDYKEYYDIIFQMIEEDFGYLEEAINVATSGQVTTGDTTSLGDDFPTKVAKIGKLGTTGKHYAKTFITRIDALDKIASQITDNNQTFSSLKDICKKYQVEKEACKASLEEWSNSMANGTSGGKGISIKVNKDSKEESLKTVINDFVKAYNILFNAASVQGQFFENVIAAAITKIDKETSDGLREAVKSAVVGDKRDYVYLNIDEKFQESFLENSGRGLTKDNINGTNIIRTTTNTQGKVDVTFEIGDPANKLNISAKAYNLKHPRNITLVSGSSLLEILQQQPDFLNHYLNIKAISTGNLANSAYGAAAENGVRAVALYHAFVGDRFGRNEEKANVFIVKDVSKTGADSVYIYNIKDIYKKALRNMSMDGHAKDDKGKYARVEIFNNNKLSSANKWDERGPEARIGRVLAAAHSIKLHVAISSSILNNDDNSE